MGGACWPPWPRCHRPFETKTQAKMSLRRAVEAVAEKLGNTATICRKCYIHPDIIACYLAGRLPVIRADERVARSGLPGRRPRCCGCSGASLRERRAKAAAPKTRAGKFGPNPAPKAIGVHPVAAGGPRVRGRAKRLAGCYNRGVFGTGAMASDQQGGQSMQGEEAIIRVLAPWRRAIPAPSALRRLRSDHASAGDGAGAQDRPYREGVHFLATMRRRTLPGRRWRSCVGSCRQAARPVAYLMALSFPEAPHATGWRGSRRGSPRRRHASAAISSAATPIAGRAS